MLLAGLVRVAGVAAAVSRDGGEPFHVSSVALVVDKRPGAIERGRAEIIRIPAHRVAGSIADATIDALDGGVGGAARGVVGRDALDRLRACLRRRETALRLLPFVEELAHVG